jgi:eukaryotic-like serine/threonine-protein kinase
VTKHRIKLLDFGLAKQQPALKENGATMTESLTAAGQILGTLQYMSPEQLQGREADARSDLFSFGCVLYEMLSGNRAFQGGSPASVIAAILERDPALLEITQPLNRVVRKSLAKDPDERLQTARDLKASLIWATEQPSVAATHRARRPWLADLSIAALIAIAWDVGGWAIARYSNHEPPIESRPIRYTIQPPENISYAGGKVSPDGRWLAFIGIGTPGGQLWVRRLDSLAAQPLGKADSDLFWSPDSRFIAFLQDGRLMKIEPTGGAAQTICATALVIGGSWNREGTIIFGDSETISQAPAKDGEAKRVTTLDASREETAHSTPFFLPDGRHFLYTTYSAQIRLTPCRSSIKAGTNEFHDGLFEYVRNDNLDTPSPFDGSQIPPFRRISSVPNSTDQ